MSIGNRPHVILTCDDFGMHESINDAALQCYQSGLLCSVSLVANGDAYASALNTLSVMKGIQVGLHFNIVEGRPVSDLQFELLTKADGTFHDSVFKLAMMGWRNKKKLCYELEIELQAQIDKVRETGLECSHLDSHRHIHLLPSLAQSIASVMKKNKFLSVRNTNSTSNLNLFKSPIKLLSNFIFGYSRKYYSGFHTNDEFVGFFHSGNVAMSTIVEQVTDHKLYEIGMHLGTDNKVLEDYFQWGRHGYQAHWSEELELVTSDSFKELVIEKFELTSFHNQQDVATL